MPRSWATLRRVFDLLGSAIVLWPLPPPWPRAFWLFGSATLGVLRFRLARLIAASPSPLAEARERRLAFSAIVADTVPEWLEADRERLRQVLAELCATAIGRTEQGSVRLRLDAKPPADGLVALSFAVEHTGHGIAVAERESLLPAFTRADASASRRRGSFGLGLAVCRELCALMGGTLALSGAPGMGSVFSCTVALPPAAMPPSRAAMPAAARPKVLVVEDNAVNLLVARGLLERLGCVVETATSGRRALRRFEPGRFDLVLMDCQMPELDGYQTTAKLRAQEVAAGFRAPIVALTANAIGGDREECLRAGMDDYLAKPLRLATLRRIVWRWCGMTATGGEEEEEAE